MKTAKEFLFIAGVIGCIFLFITILISPNETHKKVYIELWMNGMEQEPLKTKIHELRIYDDHIEMSKWVKQSDGNYKYVTYTCQKENIDSLHFEPTEYDK